MHSFWSKFMPLGVIDRLKQSFCMVGLLSSEGSDLYIAISILICFRPHICTILNKPNCLHTFLKWDNIKIKLVTGAVI